MTTHEVRGTFEVALRPAESLLEGTARFDFTKTWSGELTGTSTGLMASAGDPGQGNAGYVALEVFCGTLGDHTGGFVMQQCGQMVDGDPKLIYVIAPGSGTGDLVGITGTVDLDVVDGVHHVVIHYTL